jgi:hypothetical protein
MLAARFIGRHWIALGVLSVLLLVISGGVGRDLGLYFLFRTDQRLEARIDSVFHLVTSRPFLTGFYLSYLISFLYCYSLNQDAMDRGRAASKTGWFDLDPAPATLGSIILNVLPFVIIPVALFNFPLSDAVESPPNGDRWMHLLGALAGLLPVSLIALTSSTAGLRWTQTSIGRILYSPRCRMVAMLLMMLVINMSFDARYSFASVINLTGWIVLVYLLWNALPAAAKAAALLGVIVAILSPQTLDFRNRFGAMDPDYWTSRYPTRVAVPDHPESFASRPSKLLLVDPVAALDNWHKAAGPAEGKKGKLVILAASGGGYRATIWTAHVIDRLRAESGSDGRLPGIIDSVRLVTGASGGMVANAYFVAQQQAACGASRSRSLVDQIQSDVSQYYAMHGYTGERGNDSLSAVARQWVKADLFGLGLGRARVLENQWLSLCSSLESLSVAERDGKAPSFIVAPTVVEDGRPMLISNLDLSRIGPRDAGLAWDFSRLFDEGHKLLKLQTAVRMGAAFPYITPAEELPTRPPMRLADAGYSDNYGVTTAVAYLGDPNVKRWIEGNLAGVLIIEIWSHAVDGTQIRCGARSSELKTSETRAAAANSPSSPAIFDRVTEPLTTAFAAREITMVARNRQALASLADKYPRGMIRQVVLDSRVAASLSWYLPEKEVKCLREQWGPHSVHPNYNGLAEAWLN